jgi:hypothetical protein
MGIDLEHYKKRIKTTIKEILENDSTLNELFDTLPFKTDFDFKENSDEVYIDIFNDPKQNKIKIYFYKGNNKNIFMLDFTVNGHSGKGIDVNYSLKEYTSLLGTIAKATSQFLDKYKPQALKIDGEDTLDKEYKGKKGQKNSIYNYFADNLELNYNYRVTDRKPDGSFNLSRKGI